jgi:hypothetical protein
MREKDYSQYVTNPSKKEDDRPFLLRLLLSIRPSMSFSTRKIKSSNDIKKGLSFKITGGTDF